jgi:hypothetical protein
VSYGRRSTQVRLSDLTDLGVPVAWHEAVAVIRVVAQLLLLDPHAEPDATRVWLYDDGTLRIEPPPRRRTPPVAGGPAGLTWPPADDEIDDVLAMEVARDGALRPVRDTPGQLVAALAALLATLLPPSAPEGLRALAATDRSDTGAADVDRFLAAVTFFARPDDDTELRGLASRAIAAHEAAERSAALRALTERARAAPPAPAAAPAAAPRRRLAIAAATAGAGLVLAGVVAAGWWVAQQPSGTSSVTPPPVTDASTPRAGARPSAPERGAARRRRPAQTVTAERPPSVSTSIEPAGERRPIADRSAPALPAGSTVDADDRASRITDREAAVREETAAVGAAPAGPGPATSEGVDEGRIYDARDPGVAPPTPVRTHMPKRPLTGVSLQPPGTLELIVDEDGGVLLARLVPTSARLQDRVMVSAAKTWRFTPARRDGQPVRYRLHMPITW